MIEHKTPLSMVVDIFEGKVAFGIHGIRHNLEKDLVALEGDMLAMEDSIDRHSLSIVDNPLGVEDVEKNIMKKRIHFQSFVKGMNLILVQPYLSQITVSFSI